MNKETKLKKQAEKANAKLEKKRKRAQNKKRNNFVINMSRIMGLVLIGVVIYMYTYMISLSEKNYCETISKVLDDTYTNIEDRSNVISYPNATIAIIENDKIIRLVEKYTLNETFNNQDIGTYTGNNQAYVFIKSLPENTVDYKKVTINNENCYLIGKNVRDYSICAIINVKDMNNADFLAFYVIMAGICGVYLIFHTLIVQTCAFTINTQTKTIEEQNETVTSLNSKIVALNAQISEECLYDTNESLWDASILSEFLVQLADRKVFPFALTRINVPNEERENLIESLKLYVGKKVVKFNTGENEITLLFIKLSEDEIKNLLSVILPEHCNIKDTKTYNSIKDIISTIV